MVLPDYPEAVVVGEKFVGVGAPGNVLYWVEIGGKNGGNDSRASLCEIMAPGVIECLGIGLWWIVVTESVMG